MNTHLFSDVRIWVLHGHLSHDSICRLKKGQSFEKGDMIAYVGSKAENGGWNPHVHVQMSLVEPVFCDLPGVVLQKNHAKALEHYPDPRLILGVIYVM